MTLEEKVRAEVIKLLYFHHLHDTLRFYTEDQKQSDWSQKIADDLTDPSRESVQAGYELAFLSRERMNEIANKNCNDIYLSLTEAQRNVFLASVKSVIEDTMLKSQDPQERQRAKELKDSIDLNSIQGLRLGVISKQELTAQLAMEFLRERYLADLNKYIEHLQNHGRFKTEQAYEDLINAVRDLEDVINSPFDINEKTAVSDFQDRLKKAIAPIRQANEKAENIFGRGNKIVPQFVVSTVKLVLSLLLLVCTIGAILAAVFFPPLFAGLVVAAAVSLVLVITVQALHEKLMPGQKDIKAVSLLDKNTEESLSVKSVFFDHVLPAVADFVKYLKLLISPSKKPANALDQFVKGVRTLEGDIAHKLGRNSNSRKGKPAADNTAAAANPVADRELELQSVHTSRPGTADSVLSNDNNVFAGGATRSLPQAPLRAWKSSQIIDPQYREINPTVKPTVKPGSKK